MERDASRGVEGPGPMTLRQPTFGHGGNAGIDEEVAMVTSIEGIPLNDRDQAANLSGGPTCAEEADRA